MTLSLLKRSASLACACALAFTAALSATPAHAQDQGVQIEEQYSLSASGSITYRLKIVDLTKTITLDTCNSLSQVIEWSEVQFKAASAASNCQIATEYTRDKNPYVGTDQEGNFVFAAKSIQLSDLNIVFPAGTSLTQHEFYFSADTGQLSQMSPGGKVSDSVEGFITWKGDVPQIVGVVGTIEKAEDFRTTSRVEYQGIAPVELPSGLEDIPARPSTTSTPFTPATGVLPYRGDREMSSWPSMKLLIGAVVILIVSIAILTLSARKSSRPSPPPPLSSPGLGK